ncbi:MAG: LysR family transcriptional regulator [Hyphomonadaceae bacterium]
MSALQVSLRQLRHLVVLSEEAHFGRAAERLSLSQPALSRSIKALEGVYGVALIERGESAAFLTRSGEEAVRLARAVLQNAAHLDEALRAESRGGAGTVFAGFAPLPAAIALAEVCIHTLRDRPSVRLYTDVQPMASLMEQLARSSYDFVVCSPRGLTDAERFDVQAVRVIPFDMIVRAKHPLAGRRRVSAEEVRRFPLIGAHTRPMGRLAEFDAGTSFSELGPLALTSDNYDTLARVTLASDAIWLTSRLAAGREIKAGKLMCLNKAGLGLPDSIELALMTMKGASLSPATRAVMEDIRAVLAGA